MTAGTPWQVGQVLFKASVCMVASGCYNVNGEWEPSRWGPTARIDVNEYTVLRLTPKGAWVSICTEHWQSEPEWVGHTSKRFAVTREAALLQLVHRKRAHVRHASRRLRDAETGLRAAARAAGVQAHPK